MVKKERCCGVWRFLILTLTTALLSGELNLCAGQVWAQKNPTASVSENSGVLQSAYKEVTASVNGVMEGVSEVETDTNVSTVESVDSAKAASNFTSINPVIDVGDKIYVQHYEREESDGSITYCDTYDLQKSDTGTTTVYEVMLPEFTAHRAWTPQGVYMENVALKSGTTDFEAHGATAPEDYIPVKAGEEYFFRLYGVWGTNNAVDGKIYYYTPVLFLNDNDEVVGTALHYEMSKSKSGRIVTVPEGATKMHLTNYNNQGFTIQKVLYLTDEQFDNLPINKTDLENEINEKYEEFVKDKTVYDKFDKAYITFVNDDTWGSIHDYANLFIEKDIPLVLATIPELLIENSSSTEETRLEVARRVEQAGGEIIAHNGAPLTREGFSDYSTMYSYFVRTKQMFNAYNLDVNGIILSGGTGQVTGAEETERWASSIYSYSDLYGVKGENLNNVYFYGRGNIGNYNNDLDKIKQEIDSTIENKTWRIFYFHTSYEIKDEVLEQVLDYVNSRSEEEVEVVTYKEMYEKKAAKESDVINNKRTYYVSSTGTSNSGINMNDPMSYEAANKTTFFSGDTILFKRGEDYYGAFNPTIKQVDDSITTIGAYGEGEMPNILGYKIANSESSWELDTEGIYKINLTDTQYFTGLTTTDANGANIGFLEDNEGVKYYNKKGTMDELESEYDFYCDGTYLYIKCDENPYKKLGELKLATKTNLIVLHSNMKIENLRICGTGAHGLLGADTTTKNVEISNNVIEDIGGSFLSGTTRYGNGIEFYGTDVSDTVVKNNLIRNVYDVGFTIQGTRGSGTDVVVRNNVFVSNTQDSEIWESEAATGVRAYDFINNISVNQGRGWGYDARTDKYPAAHILFWSYKFDDTDICFYHNKVYNPRRIYFVEQSNGSNVFFKEKDLIKSNYNEYFITKGVPIFRDYYKIGESEDAIESFIADYKKDMNSTFTMIEVDEELVQVATTSNKIEDIKKFFLTEEEMEEEMEEETKEENTEDVNREEQDKESVSQNDTTQGNEAEEGNTSNEGVENGSSGEPGSVSIEPSAPAKGSSLSDGKGTYKVTVSNISAGTVEYVKPESKTASTIKIPETITVDGITYQVTSIGDDAFKNNKNVKKITIGSNVTTIGKNAFYGCKNLKTVTIGKNVKTIKDKAFYKCTALTKITIPSKVTKIGKQAFYGCKKLKTITIKTTKLKSSKVGSKAFKGIPKNVKVKVPKTRLDSYKDMLIKKGISKSAKITK